MSVTAIANEVSGYNTTRGEWVASLAKSAIRVDFANTVVGVPIGAWVAGPVSMGIELGTAA